jgi:hypothetical protein
MQFNELNAAALMTHPDVIRRTTEIATNVFKRPRSARQRTYEKIYADSLLGVALEHAVFNAMVQYALDRKWNWTVEFAPDSDRSYDISVRTPKGNFLIDVKAMRDSVLAKTFTVNSWEAEHADPRTIYLVFDTAEEDAAWCAGWFECQELQPSYKFHGYFAWLRNFRTEEQLPF